MSKEFGNFDEATQKEIAAFLEKEQASARVQAAVQNFTSVCWDKCITGTPSTRFSRGEESCLVNCVDRFLDTSIYLIKQLEHQRDNLANSHS